MKKIILTSLLFGFILSGIPIQDTFSATPKKKTKMEKRLKKQEKKKKRKGDTTCPKIDC